MDDYGKATSEHLIGIQVDNHSHSHYAGDMRSLRLLIPAICGVALISCSGTNTTTDSSSNKQATITVAASFYPIAEIVARVGGDNVDLVALTPPGEGAHDVQLTAKSLDQLASSELVFYISDGFQPDIEKAVSSLPDSVKAVDLLTSLELLPIVAQLEGTEGETDGEVLASGKDPHVWLDPANMVTMTRSVADAMGQSSPDLSATFATNAAAYIAELETLGNDIDTTFANCESRALVTSHRAFAYLAKRANLTQVAISGVNPEEEPSAKNLEAIAAFAVKNKVSTIFFETLLPADLAKTLADKVGAKADLLDPIEGLSSEDLADGASYISVQRDNLTRISLGLRCS